MARVFAKILIEIESSLFLGTHLRATDVILSAAATYSAKQAVFLSSDVWARHVRVKAGSRRKDSKRARNVCEGVLAIQGLAICDTSSFHVPLLRWLFTALFYGVAVVTSVTCFFLRVWHAIR